MNRRLLVPWRLIAGVVMALAPIAAARAAADEPLTLVVHTAADCPVCKAWRESATGLATARRLARDGPALTLVIVERHSLHGSEAESDYPPALRPLYQAREARYQLAPPVPLFELVRGERIVSRHAGLQGWADGTLPEIRQWQAAGAASAPAGR